LDGLEALWRLAPFNLRGWAFVVMATRTVLLLGFIAGSVFGATLLMVIQDSATPSNRGIATGTNSPARRVLESEEISGKKEHEARSEDLERARSDLAREREKVAQLREKLEKLRVSKQTPTAAVHRAKRRSRGVFDAGALEASGFVSEDIDWFRDRWERAEREKQYLAELEARGEAAPLGGGYADIERELREDLRDDGYDAMLYATGQDNRVVLMQVRNNSIAYRAGIREGSVVWSYDGERVFHPRELAKLSTTGRRGETVEVVIVTRDGPERFFVERDPLGAELVSEKAKPHPE
jgi:hypothetical protein